MIDLWNLFLAACMVGGFGWACNWLLGYQGKRVPYSIGDPDTLAVDLLRAAGYTKRAAQEEVARRSAVEVLRRARARINPSS